MSRCSFVNALRSVALGLAVLCAGLAAAHAEERIERFVSDVHVARNGDLDVTETISIRAEGVQVRHGILRDFPTTYTRTDGSRVVVGFDVLSVTRDGQDEPYATEKMANGVRVRIGSARTFVRTGLHDYVIKYRTTRQIGFFKSFDELHWNVTGTGWTFPIDMAEARITLPARVPFIQTAVYTGPQGAKGKNATVVSQEPGHIVFRTTAPLPVRNGLTVAAAWQKGIVQPPDSKQQLDYLLEDSPGLSYAAIGVPLIVLFYLAAWFMVGRDPRRGTVIPLFAPPDGMCPAAVRYVENMNFDNRAFTAAIVNMGVNGHIKLTGSDSEGKIKHMKGGKPLDRAELAIEKALFKDKASVDLDQSDHEAINNAKLALWRSLKESYSGTLFNNNFTWSWLGFLASAVLVALIGHAVLNDYGPRGGAMLAGLLVPILPLMIAASIIRSGKREGKTFKMLMGLIVGVVAVAIGLALSIPSTGVSFALLPAAAVYALAAMVSLGFGWLQAPSKAGRAIMDRIEGFKQYLGVAEEDRLEFLNPPQKTPELFERFLPYAIALDVENTWARRFAGVLAAAGTAAAVNSWYSGGTDWTRDPEGFVDRLGGQLSQTIASASTAPGSSSSDSDSGSSGGGSSGGGGGGGGGSGW